MVNSSEQDMPVHESGLRSLLSILLPAGAAVLTSIVAGSIWDVNAMSSQATTAVLLSAAALTSWLLGLRWYGLEGMGLRGGRALSAGIGFASLLWILFILLRFFFVDIAPEAIAGRPPDAARTYIYLLLFEALATQIWTFGLIFRSVSAWRGPITAAIVSGLVFGLVALMLFQESFASSLASTAYFIAWGILYGIIRLRTGGFLGTAIVQSVQSFTVWVVLAPYPEPNLGQLNNLYLAATIVYMIIGWRLWPKNEGDYRV